MKLFKAGAGDLDFEIWNSNTRNSLKTVIRFSSSISNAPGEYCHVYGQYTMIPGLR
jgi:hypothetical protein